MPKQITITLRGKDYPVIKLAGMTALAVIRTGYSKEQLLDPDFIQRTAKAIKQVIPSVPDELISETTISLLPEEFYDLFNQLRSIFFIDNLGEIRKVLKAQIDENEINKFYNLEYQYAQGASRLAAYLEFKKEKEQEEPDWSWDQTVDVRIDLEDAPQDKIWKHFEHYYQGQIKFSEKENNSFRVKKLNEILSIAQENFNQYYNVIAKGINKKNQENQRIIALQKQVEELQQKQPQNITE